MTLTPEIPREIMRAVIITGPSGAGKSTLAQRLRQFFPQLDFSVSVTTRPPRPGEQHGVHYYFWDVETFRKKVQEGAFIEYEEVYPGVYYGTLWRELQRIHLAGNIPLFDIDVRGAWKIKQLLGRNALVVFIHPGSLQILIQRLRQRGTESGTNFWIRVRRATLDLHWQFIADVVLYNLSLQDTEKRLHRVVRHFLASCPDPQKTLMNLPVP